MKIYTVLCALLSLTLLKAEPSCNEITDPEENKECSKLLQKWFKIKDENFVQCCEALISIGQQDLYEHCESQARRNATKSLQLDENDVEDRSGSLGNPCNTKNDKCQKLDFKEKSGGVINTVKGWLDDFFG